MEDFEYEKVNMNIIETTGLLTWISPPPAPPITPPSSRAHSYWAKLDCHFQKLSGSFVIMFWSIETTCSFFWGLLLQPCPSLPIHEEELLMTRHLLGQAAWPWPHTPSTLHLSHCFPALKVPHSLHLQIVLYSILSIYCSLAFPLTTLFWKKAIGFFFFSFNLQ